VSLAWHRRFLCIDSPATSAIDGSGSFYGASATSELLMQDVEVSLLWIYAN
jgi:hypothetical protein